MKRMLYWWLIVCVIGVGVYLTYVYDLLIPLYDNDITRLTYLITAVLGLTTASIGYKAFKKRSMHLEWFASDVVLSLGMVGTIVGFMVMLYGTFSQIDVTDVASVRAVLALLL
mgnify:CR=1 FL=1